MDPAAASVRPEAGLAGSVSARAGVHEPGPQSAEGGEGLADAVSRATLTRYWLEPNPRPLASLLRHPSPAQAHMSFVVQDTSLCC